MNPAIREAIRSSRDFETITAATKRQTERFRQIDKDVWLRANGDVKSAVWHFYESPVTGLVGPSGPLRQALTNVGIKVVCPACPVQ